MDQASCRALARVQVGPPYPHKHRPRNSGDCLLYQSAGAESAIVPWGRRLDTLRYFNCPKYSILQARMSLELPDGTGDTETILRECLDVIGQRQDVVRQQIAATLHTLEGGPLRLFFFVF